MNMQKSFLILSICTGVGLGAIHHVQAQPRNFMEKTGDVMATDGSFQLQSNKDYRMITRGKSQIIEVDEKIADVLVGDLAIVEVGAIKRNKLYLIGAALGDTNITLFNEDGDVIEQFDIHVRVDEDTLQNTIAKTFPNENIHVKTVNDDIMLSGMVSNPATAARVEELAARFAGPDNGEIINLMGVQGEQQVSLHVKVMEVSRSILNQLGVSLGATYADGGVNNGINSLQLTAINGALSGSGSAGMSLGDLGSLSFSTLFNALEQNGYAVTLAEPNLTAISGENARFLAGGEFPIISAYDNVNNEVTYSYRPIGASLAFKPVVLSKNRINLNVSTEVSSVSDTLALDLGGGITIPGFDVRRAETSVELPSGGTLVLAGLIESQTVHSLDTVPGIKNIPIIGDLLTSENFSRNESEVIITIQSFLVKPYADQDTAADVTLKKNNTPLNKALITNLQNHYYDDTLESFQSSNEFGYLID